MTSNLQGKKKKKKAKKRAANVDAFQLPDDLDLGNNNMKDDLPDLDLANDGDDDWNPAGGKQREAFQLDSDPEDDFL